MSIETKLDQLIQAITDNTAALNAVLTASGNTVAATPPKQRKTKTEPLPEVVAEEHAAGQPVEIIVPELEVEEAPIVEQAPEPEAPTDPVEPEAPKPELSGITATDIREYVKKVQGNYAKTGGNTQKIITTVKKVREEFGVANLNDLTPEQTGPFMAQIVELLPLKD